MDHSTALKTSKSENISFCTSANFKSAAVYLSQELQNLGLKYKIIEGNGEKINLVSLVNNCWDLIQLYHSSLKENRNLHENRQKDTADLSFLKTAVKELRANIKDNERQILETQEKERQLNVVNNAVALKFRVEKDEVKRLSSVLQQRDIQHQHESKKLELSVNKLKDRISRLISNDRSSSIPAMRMSSSLDKNQGARGRWKTEHSGQTHEAELYQKVFSRYEAWINQLVDETEIVKEFLGDVGQKLAALSNRCATTHLDSFIEDKDLLNGSLTSSVFHPETTENAIFAGQFAISKDQIRKNFDDHLHVIERALQFGVTTIAPAGDVNRCELDAEAEFVAEGLCVEQKAQLLDEHKKLQEQRRLLESEREKFATAAVRLNREKAEFELEKVELLRQQFLSELPSQTSCNESQATEPELKATPDDSFWHDFLNEPVNKHFVLPCITSPKGNIRLTETATFLGPNTFRQPLQRSQRLSRTCVGTPTEGTSAPSSRPPSLTRNMSSANLERECRTLETRGRRSNLTKSSSRAQDPLLFTYPRISASDLSAADATLGRESRGSHGYRMSTASHELETHDDLYSLDSGLGQDRDEADHQVGKRLTVLEHSLVSLLNKIEAKKELNRGSSSSSSDSDLSGRYTSLAAPIVNNSMTNSPSATLKRTVARSRPSLPLKLITAPSSLAPTRKPSREHK